MAQGAPCLARPMCTPEESSALPVLNDEDHEGSGETGAGADNSAAAAAGGGGGGERGTKTVGELARLCYEDPCRGLLEVKKQERCFVEAERGGGWRLCATFFVVRHTGMRSSDEALLSRRDSIIVCLLACVM